MRRSDMFFLGALMIAVAAVAGGLWFGESAGRTRSQNSGSSEPAAAAVGGPFALTDQFGATVTEADLIGKWTVIYFGYTFCPDVCPVALQNITKAVQDLGAKGDKVTPMFVTVDPKRDTVAALKEYAPNFHPRMRFLTGSEEQVQRAAASYKVYRAVRAATPDDPDYLVDHTSIVYVMGPNGKYVTHFSHGTTAAEMAERLRKLL